MGSAGKAAILSVFNIEKGNAPIIDVDVVASDCFGKTAGGIVPFSNRVVLAGFQLVFTI